MLIREKEYKVISNIKSAQHYGDTSMSDAFGKTVDEVFKKFNADAKEKPSHIGLYAAEALGDIASEARLALTILESRLNRLEEKLD